MYDPQDLLNQIDNHTAPILIGFAIAMVFQTLLMGGALVAAKKDGLYSIPLFCTFFWFAHDVGCVVRFDDWFNTYDHWFMKCFWLGLVSAMLLEFVFFFQIIKYGRAEILPNWTTRQFALLIAGGALGGIVWWEYVRTVFDDPLYLMSPAPTMLSYAFFGVALYIRRGGPAGQTAVMWAGHTLMATAWWTTSIAFLTDEFRSWQYIATGVVSVAVGAAMTYIVHRACAAERLNVPVATPAAAGEPATV